MAKQAKEETAEATAEKGQIEAPTADATTAKEETAEATAEKGQIEAPTADATTAKEETAERKTPRKFSKFKKGA